MTSGDIFTLTFEPGGGAGTTSFDVSLGDKNTGTTFHNILDKTQQRLQAKMAIDLVFL